MCFSFRVWEHTKALVAATTAGDRYIDKKTRTQSSLRLQNTLEDPVYSLTDDEVGDFRFLVLEQDQTLEDATEGKLRCWEAWHISYWVIRSRYTFSGDQLDKETAIRRWSRW